MAATANGSTPDEKTDPFVELANRNLYSYGWNTDRLEFLPQLRGRKAAELYREMSQNDALIGAILFAITMLLRRVPWEVEPGTSGLDGQSTDQDIDRADFLQTCMDDMSVTWPEVVSNALTMLPFGHAFLELVYKRRVTDDIEAEGESRTKHPDGRVGWRKMVLVSQETISDWELDEHGGVQAVVQGGSYGESRVRIPIEKGLLFRTDQRSPKGTSVLRTVVESWYFRKRIREIEGIGIERDLAGLPVFTIDIDSYQNPTRLAEYQNIVRNLRRDEQEGVILPGVVDESGKLVATAELTLLSSSGSRQFDTNQIIARYSREIAMALLQDVILLGHEKVGTQALASEKRDLSDTALGAWLTDIAETLNKHAVPRLFALNGESLQNLPQLVPGELRPTDVNEFAEALASASQGGFIFSDDPEVEAEVRRRLGLPPMPPEVHAKLVEDQLNDDPAPVPVVPPVPVPGPETEPPVEVE
jgi:hypothetical protein